MSFLCEILDKYEYFKNFGSNNWPNVAFYAMLILNKLTME